MSQMEGAASDSSVLENCGSCVIIIEVVELIWISYPLAIAITILVDWAVKDSIPKEAPKYLKALILLLLYYLTFLIQCIRSIRSVNNYKQHQIEFNMSKRLICINYNLQKKRRNILLFIISRISKIIMEIYIFTLEWDCLGTFLFCLDLSQLIVLVFLYIRLKN